MFRDFYGTPSQAKAYIGFDADKANEMLARLNIAPNARLRTLSKGNKEKVQLVLAMSRAARLYLLDEPIGGGTPPRATTSCTPSSATTARTQRSSCPPTSSGTSSRCWTRPCS